MPETPEQRARREIDAAAAKIKERLDKISGPGVGTPTPTNQEITAAYGAPGSTAGGGAPGQRRDELHEKMQDFEQRFNSSTRGSAIKSSPNDSQASVTDREIAEYTKNLLSARTISHLAKNSHSPDLRARAARIDPNTLKERV